MGLYYTNTITQPFIGTKSGTTRTSVELASTYTLSKTIETSGYSKLNLDVLYTMGSGESSNSIEIKVEGSPDRTNFYRIPNDSTTNGTSTLTAREFTFVGTNAAAATISIGIDIFYKYVKISAKETGVAANAGTIYIEGTLAGK